MPVSVPPPEVLGEFLGATTRHTRRIEIYEQDGTTRWDKDKTNRLKDGSVTVDYTRDERRALDLTLSNDDRVLISAPGEFWYDKIIKVFRGVRVNQKVRIPKILIIADSTTTPHAVAFRQAASALGYGDVQINTLAATYAVDIAPYDIIVGFGNQDKGTLFYQALQNGKSVFTFRGSSDHLFNAAFTSTGWTKATSSSPSTSFISPQHVSDPRTLGWLPFPPQGDGGTYSAPIAITSVDASLFGVALASGSTTAYAVTSLTGAGLGKAASVHYKLVASQYSDPQFRNMLRSLLDWLNPVVRIAEWETQVGEFMIDRISAPHFPFEVQITGRDYTKKCMNSKFSQATQFDAGMALEELIGVLATAAGITKRVLPVTGITVDQSFFFDRNTSRWDAMKQIATAYNYEIYFDATGYLVIRLFRDPTTSTPVIWIETGIEGQIASYSKSTSDSSLFNHILVTGESSDQTVIPVYAEAINTDPTSSTNITEIGDRYWEYSSPLITATQQAQDLADTYLAIHSLEEFELDFETLFLPWLEGGDILGFMDPDPAPGDPRTFLLSQLTLPLKLGPMSGVGKRTTIVGFS